MDNDLLKELALFTAFGVMVGWFFGPWGFLIIAGLFTIVYILTEEEDEEPDSFDDV